MVVQLRSLSRVVYRSTSSREARGGRISNVAIVILHVVTSSISGAQAFSDKYIQTRNVELMSLINCIFHESGGLPGPLFKTYPSN